MKIESCNIIGNREDHEQSHPIMPPRSEMSNLGLDDGNKSTMKTRSAYKGTSVFVNAGVKQTREQQQHYDEF